MVRWGQGSWPENNVGVCSVCWAIVSVGLLTTAPFRLRLLVGREETERVGFPA